MLFNSYSFLFGFLPIALAGYFGLARLGQRFAAGWLALASLGFYAWWEIRFLPVLGLSIIWNFGAGCLLHHLATTRQAGLRRFILLFAIAGDLAALGYYKYVNFFIGVAGDLTGLHFAAVNVILPLGISFFTFTQIAFLVDTAQGKAREFNFINYVLFVTYFPHLIAGPILHHKQMMPQFASPETYVPRSANFATGAAYFTIGLVKKCLLADSFAPDAAAAFNAAGAVTLGVAAAWKGAIAYTLQLYFDFSGYIDMAIGLSLCFGVRLPLNFDSPYRATNIIDFWRRWHMTLSQFLRDYLYIPLGGNRHGATRRYVNLMATMLLGGLWHGASWTFVIWGGLHGFYLVLNHAWQRAKPKAALQRVPASIRLAAATLTTFLAVVVAWVFFRAPDLAAALHVLKSMAGFNGLGALPARSFSDIDLFLMMAKLPNAITFWNDVALYVGGLAIVFFLPNSQSIVEPDRYGAAPNGLPTVPLRWQPSLAWGLVMGLGVAACLTLFMSTSEFLYFQF